MTRLSMGTGFAQLFKKYRLRSEIETLAEFGDLLAEEGFVYETSLFTRWQKGDRIPKERRVLLAILRVFVKRGGILSIEEANDVIRSVNQKDLTFEESSGLSEFLQSSNTKTLPAKPYLFIGRDTLLKEVSWELINKKKVVLYGMPGVGKTYIAIYLAHQLKNFFTDGIFWFRADLKSVDDIIDELLRAFGAGSYLLTDKQKKQEKLHQILSKRNILLVLDNASNFIESDLNVLASFPLTVLITSIDIYSNKNLNSFKVNIFSEDEFIKLCENILGKPYVRVNKYEICKIGYELGFLPISSVISVKQIYSDPVNIRGYITKIKEERMSVRDIRYDDKNLFVAIDLAYSRLNQRTKNVLLSCGAFEGSDFGLKALSAINNLTLSETKGYVNDLMKLSLIEYSSLRRYRLHPVIKNFLQTFLKPEVYILLSKFYIKEINKLKSKDEKYFQFFSREHENILGLLVKNYAFKNFRYVTRIWPLISSYIFISGKWEVIHKYDSLIQDSYRFGKDEVGRAIYLIEDLGRVYFFQKHEKKLMVLFNECVNIATKHNDQVLSGLIMQKKGIVCLYSNDLDNAKFLLLKTIKILLKSQYKEQLYKSYAYLGMTYAKLGEYGIAISYILKALKNIQVLQDAAVVGFIYLYLGNSYLKMRNYLFAEKYLQLALQNAKKSDVLIEHALASEGLGVLYSKLDNSDMRAENYLKEAKNKFKLLGMQETSKFFE